MVPTSGRPQMVGSGIRVFVPERNHRRGVSQPNGTASVSCPDRGAESWSGLCCRRKRVHPAGRPVRQRCAECTVRRARVPVARRRRAGVGHGRCAPGGPVLRQAGKRHLRPETMRPGACGPRSKRINSAVIRCLRAAKRIAPTARPSLEPAIACPRVVQRGTGLRPCHVGFPASAPWSCRGGPLVVATLARCYGALWPTRAQ